MLEFKLHPILLCDKLYIMKAQLYSKVSHLTTDITENQVSLKLILNLESSCHFSTYIQQEFYNNKLTNIEFNSGLAYRSTPP